MASSVTRSFLDLQFDPFYYFFRVPTEVCIPKTKLWHLLGICMLSSNSLDTHRDDFACTTLPHIVVSNKRDNATRQSTKILKLQALGTFTWPILSRRCSRQNATCHLLSLHHVCLFLKEESNVVYRFHILLVTLTLYPMPDLFYECKPPSAQVTEFPPAFHIPHFISCGTLTTFSTWRWVHRWS